MLELECIISPPLNYLPRGVMQHQSPKRKGTQPQLPPPPTQLFPTGKVAWAGGGGHAPKSWEKKNPSAGSSFILDSDLSLGPSLPLR